MLREKEKTWKKSLITDKNVIENSNSCHYYRKSYLKKTKYFGFFRSFWHNLNTFFDINF